MKKHIFFILISSLLLTACANTRHTPGQMASNLINRESVIPITNDVYPSKNPHTVAVFNSKKVPPAAYRIIGIAQVSKFNLIGAARETELVHQRMRHLAASIGGDGLIDVDNTSDHIEAKVIAFQRIMI